VAHLARYIETISWASIGLHSTRTTIEREEVEFDQLFSVFSCSIGISGIYLTKFIKMALVNRESVSGKNTGDRNCDARVRYNLVEYEHLVE